MNSTIATPTVSPSTSVFDQYKWEPQPDAERLVQRLVADFLGSNAWAAAFADRLYKDAGVRFADVVDHVHVPPAAASVADVLAAGFEPVPADRHAYAHPGGIFPTLVVGPPADHGVAVRVESVADFLAIHGMCAEHTGRPGDRVRTAPVVPAAAGVPGLAVVERHGC
ncbi:MAG: hypothetical protein JWO31_2171, partial [Phycisphaerales bacterium]|nr:hypothetical protein [Phycisphaerales bacterium]